MGYTRKTYINLEKKWESPFLYSSKKLGVGYWQTNSTTAFLKMVSSDSKTYNIKHQTQLGYKDYQLITKSNQSSDKKENDYCALFVNPKEVVLVQGDTSLAIYYGKSDDKGFRITNKNQLFFGKNNSIFIVDNNLKSLFELVPIKSTGRIKINKVLSSVKCDNYIIEKLDRRKSSMMFTSSKNGTIEIRQLTE